MKWKRPLPAVGDRIKYDWGPGHESTWKCAAVVCAVVDDYAIFVRRWMPHRRGYAYEVVLRWTWEHPEMKHLTGAKTQGVPRT